jgi:hypothetical protein
MSDGATLRLMHHDEILYLAVMGDAVGAVNVVMAVDDQVSILHSSAALGSALYLATETTWVLEHGYAWCCRSKTDTSAQVELFGDERWQANIGWVGDPGVVEYAVAFPWGGAALAVSSIRDDDDKGYWPANLSEPARDQLLDIPPEEQAFHIEEWTRITPAD